MRNVARALVLLLALLLVAGCGTRRLDLTLPETQVRVGVRAAQDNLWREALFRFQRAVEMNPQNATAYNNLAVAYEGTGEFEKARAAYMEALRLDRSNEHIQRNYSRFVEFTTKNKRREVSALEAGSPAQDGAPARPAAEVQPSLVTAPAEEAELVEVGLAAEAGDEPLVADEGGDVSSIDESPLPDDEMTLQFRGER
jgi:tetratricopeptide (TPR) repeat protein